MNKLVVIVQIIAALWLLQGVSAASTTTSTEAATGATVASQGLENHQ